MVDFSPLEGNRKSSLFEQIIASWPDHILLVDRQARLLYTNEAFLRDMGAVSDPGLVGKTTTELGFPPYLADIAERCVEFVFRTGQPRTEDARILGDDGSTRHYECQFVPVTAFSGPDAGKVQSVVLSARDVTTQVLLRERLQVQEQAVNAANGGIVITDPNLPDNPITFANDGFLRLTGYSRDDVVGRNCRFLQGTGTDPGSVKIISESLAEQKAVRVLILNYRKDGTPFWNDLAITPVRDVDGKLVNFIGVQTDVTERKLAEEVLRGERDTERRTALELQRSLLIRPRATQFSPLLIEAIYEPTRAEALVGGDFYDILPLDQDTCLFAVGDASGKGFNAALRTTEVKYALRAYAREHRDPAVILQRLNQFIIETAKNEGKPNAASEFEVHFVTLALAVVNRETGKVAIATAGSEPIYRLERRARTRRLSAVTSRSLPLGLSSDEKFVRKNIRLRSGDSLLLLTDGITDAGAGGKFHNLFGEERIARTWEKFGSPTPRGFVQTLVREARVFAGGKLADDVCTLLVSWIKPTD